MISPSLLTVRQTDRDDSPVVDADSDHPDQAELRRISGNLPPNGEGCGSDQRIHEYRARHAKSDYVRDRIARHQSTQCNARGSAWDREADRICERFDYADVLHSPGRAVDRRLKSGENREKNQLRG